MKACFVILLILTSFRAFRLNEMLVTEDFLRLLVRWDNDG